MMEQSKFGLRRQQTELLIPLESTLLVEMFEKLKKTRHSCGQAFVFFTLILFRTYTLTNNRVGDAAAAATAGGIGPLHCRPVGGKERRNRG